MFKPSQRSIAAPIIEQLKRKVATKAAIAKATGYKPATDRSSTGFWEAVEVELKRLNALMGMDRTTDQWLQWEKDIIAADRIGVLIDDDVFGDIMPQTALPAPLVTLAPISSNSAVASASTGSTGPTSPATAAGPTEPVVTGSPEPSVV
ncbi:hypothetical protein M422DRAFT_29012 [Sphaerobolus stellatus SS14]|uniref:Uncharacterized protein n=1 Tax=Sphaerobolus stellatus (strain SS14) TaxID=990650 RepID=A0A0C9VVG2_SPHS4|nr:hypothetical protein M422DRAFT_29012 [Sphaerobolus stellatus SS14]